MDPRTAATRVPDPDAVEFIRFCYRRRRVGWPELYDEMCAVAARGLFHGLVTDDLAAHGIGFSLFDTPALAALAARIVAEEQAARRPVTVVIAPAAEDVAEASPMTRRSISRRSSPPWTSSSLDQRSSPSEEPRHPSVSSRCPPAPDTVPHSSREASPGPPTARGFSLPDRSAGQARMRRLAISPSIWRSAST